MNKQLRLKGDEIIVDNFAGGGGASTGIELALARAVDIAINHDADALAMHSANHPATNHLCEDVWRVDPVKVTEGRRVGAAWFSPDCTDFSKAKGGKPVRAQAPACALSGERRGISKLGPAHTRRQPLPETQGQDLPQLRLSAPFVGLRGRVARVKGVRLWRANLAQAPVPDRALRRVANHLAFADSRQAWEPRGSQRRAQTVANGRRVH
jgi:hypothetical protein